MALPTLPDELIYLILQNFDTNPNDEVSRYAWRDISRYAPVSRQWAAIVERVTFRTLTVDSRRLAQFDRIVKGQRRRHLRTLSLIIDIDFPDTRSLGPYDSLTTSDLKFLNNRRSTMIVQRLFEILSSWHEDRLDFALHFDTEPPPILWEWMKRYAEREFVFLAPEPELMERAQRRITDNLNYLGFPHSTGAIELLNTLKDISCVTKFAAHTCWGKYWPASLLRIAACFPNLKYFFGNMYDPGFMTSEEDLEWRIQGRNDLARDLESLPQSCKHLNLLYTYAALQGKLERIPSLLGAGQTLDRFSDSIAKLSRRLVSLDIDGILDMGAFLPYQSSGWPYLRSIRLGLTPITANGEWYFNWEPESIYEDSDEDEEDNEVGDEDSQDEEEDSSDDDGNERLEQDMEEESDEDSSESNNDEREGYCRSAPRADMLNEVYDTIARIVRHMPQLREFHLSFDLVGPVAKRYLCHAFTFLPYGKIESTGAVLSNTKSKSKSKAKAEWYCWPIFEPSQSVLQAWEDTAKILGRELQIKLSEPNQCQRANLISITQDYRRRDYPGPDEANNELVRSALRYLTIPSDGRCCTYEHILASFEAS